MKRGKTMLSLVDISYGYRRNKEVLHNVSITLREGITILAGENGSGKSTLIKLLTENFSENNNIFLDNQKVTGLSWRKNVSYLPQTFEIYPSLKTKDVLMFVAQAKGIPKDKIQSEVLFAAESANIVDFLNEKSKNCSEGTRRRIGIATSLLGNPKVVIMDEPTASIDPGERSNFYESVKKCFEGKIVLISTHILEDIGQLADNVIILSRGKITYSGTYEQFVSSLDGRVYSTTNIEYINQFKPKRMLSQKRDFSGDVWYSFIVEEAITMPDDSCIKSIKPSLEDLWLYYQSEKGHE